MCGCNALAKRVEGVLCGVKAVECVLCAAEMDVYLCIHLSLGLRMWSWWGRSGCAMVRLPEPCVRQLGRRTDVWRARRGGGGACARLVAARVFVFVHAASCRFVRATWRPG